MFNLIPRLLLTVGITLATAYLPALSGAQAGPAAPVARPAGLP